MFATRELTRLQLRKAELLSEGDALRGKLVQEWADIRPAISWVDGTVGLVRRFQPLLLAAAPLLGFWVARRGAPRRGLWRIVRVGWRAWRAAAAVWKTSRFLRTD